MEITNTRDVRLSVPSLHIEVDPGETVPVPDGTAIPDGFVGETAAKAPTRTQLLERAAELGLTVASKATKDAIAEAISAADIEQEPEAEGDTETTHEAADTPPATQE